MRIDTMKCGLAQSGKVFFRILWIWIRPKVKLRCLNHQNIIIHLAEENKKWTMLRLLV